MKHRNENIDFGMLWVKAGLLILAAALLVIFLPACRVSRKTSSVTETSSEMTRHYRDSIRVVDSTAIAKRLEEKYKELTTDVSFYQSNEEALIQALNELQDTISSRGYMSDSLKDRMKRVLDSIKTNPCRNEVTVNRDGSVVFKGQIQNLKLRISEMQRMMDSVANSKKNTVDVSESGSSEKQGTKIAVTKSVKKGLPGFVIAIIWLVVGYLLCWVMPPKRIVKLFT